MRKFTALLLVTALILPTLSQAGWIFPSNSRSRSPSTGGVMMGLAGAAVSGMIAYCKSGAPPVEQADPVTGEVKHVRWDCTWYEGYVKPGVESKALILYKSQTRDLRRNLGAAGQEEKKGCAAHHIVPKNASKNQLNNESRKILAACGIDIDSAMNGVYLPFDADAECEGANHKDLHTNKYYRAVFEALNAAFRNNSCTGVQEELGILKEDLGSNILTRDGYVSK